MLSVGENGVVFVTLSVGENGVVFVILSAVENSVVFRHVERRRKPKSKHLYKSKP